MRPIFIAASPNTQKDDNKLAISELFKVRNWQNMDLVNGLEQFTRQYFGRDAIAFDSARSSLYVYLKSLELDQGSEVLLPAFSCMVVANAVIWAGLKPVYVDCNKDNFNFDLEDLQKKISPKTRALLIQNTFGFPENYQEIKRIISKQAPNKIFIIEDLAHSAGGLSQGEKLGTIGDAGIITFGIEKVISGVRGGMLIVKDPVIAGKARALQATLPSFPKTKVFVSLLNPLFWSIVTPIYYWGVGKVTIGRVLVFLAHKLGIFGNMIEDCEYDACKPKWLPAKMSGSLAVLALNQFRKVDKLNDHRIKISEIYSKTLGIRYEIPTDNRHIFLRFPIVVEKQKELIQSAKKKHVVLGDWYKNILYAPEGSLSRLGYQKGMAPNAEYLAKHIVNLPTSVNVRQEDAVKIAEFVKPYLNAN